VSVPTAARSYGRKVKLNKKQMKMRDEFLAKHIAGRRHSPQPAEVCYICDEPGRATDEGGMFSTWIPPINPQNAKQGMKMDAIRGIWICAECVKDMQQ